MQYKMAFDAQKMPRCHRRPSTSSWAIFHKTSFDAECFEQATEVMRLTAQLENKKHITANNALRGGG